jgi:malate dehydrogenase
VGKRGAAIIDARGLSSAASAANAAIDHVRDWVSGTAPGEWVSMGIPSDGSYGIPPGIIFGYPVTCSGGKYSIVQGLAQDEGTKARIAVTHKELLEEADAIKHLLG